jgi:ribosome modulation factor
VGNKNKAKGTSFETVILRYIKRVFVNAYRPALQGNHDTGDINGIRGPSRDAIVQCKNQRTFKLSEWLNATVDQADNGATQLSTPLPILVVKRPGVGEKNVGDNYAIMRLSDLISLLEEAEYE